MTKFLKLMAVGAIAFFTILGVTNSSFAAAFMKLGDIKGEATDQEHKDWIIIQSMSSPIFRSTPEGASNTGMASGKRQHKPLSVTKELDKASPKIQEAATNGKVFPKVIIHVQKANYGGSRATYLKYELENVQITSYQVSSGGDSTAGTADSVPMESFSLNYEKATFDGPDAKEEAEEKPNRRQ